MRTYNAAGVVYNQIDYNYNNDGLVDTFVVRESIMLDSKNDNYIIESGRIIDRAYITEHYRWVDVISPVEQAAGRTDVVTIVDGMVFQDMIKDWYNLYCIDTLGIADVLLSNIYGQRRPRFTA